MSKKKGRSIEQRLARLESSLKTFKQRQKVLERTIQKQRKEITALKAKKIIGQKRKPVKKGKVWKVELMIGVSIYYDKLTESPDYAQVRLIKFYRIKPRDKWVESLRRKIKAIWERKKFTIMSFIKKEYPNARIYFHKPLLVQGEEAIDKFRKDEVQFGDIVFEKHFAEEVREVDQDEQTVQFGKIFLFISGEGEKEYEIDIRLRPYKPSRIPKKGRKTAKRLAKQPKRGVQDKKRISRHRS